MLDPSLIDEEREPLLPWQAILISTPLSVLLLWIVLSNLFVMLAVFGFSHMRTPSNIYIASLASTDFLVGLVILPPALLQIVHNRWTFGRDLCKTWLTLDVTLSTLSILHLIAIALDRYRVVSDGIAYLQRKQIRDVVPVLIILWCIGLWIVTPPVLGWGSWREIEVSEKYICDYSSTLGYVIHSTFGSFVFPMTVMIYTYVKIYREIQKRLNERSTVPSLRATLDLSESEASKSNLLKGKETLSNGKKGSLGSIKSKTNTITNRTRPSSQIHEFVKKKIRFSLTKERRAARTLGIIIGAFMTCWMPFCLMYFLRPIAGDPPLLVYHALTWLGYFNSAVNPIIYCVYSKDFQQVFRRIFCSCRRKQGSVSVV